MRQRNDEIRTLSILRAVAEMAEDNASMAEHIRRLEAANIELQEEIAELKARLESRAKQKTDA